MPASYLAKHRPICTVLQEIKEIAENMPSSSESEKIAVLADEATGYAQRMSAKLQEYKDEKQRGQT